MNIFRCSLEQVANLIDVTNHRTQRESGPTQWKRKLHNSTKLFAGDENNIAFPKFLEAAFNCLTALALAVLANGIQYGET